MPDLPESDDDSEEADGEDEEADEDGEAEEEEEEDEEVVEEPHTLPVQAVDERAGRQRGTSAEAGRSQRGRQRRQVQGLASDEEDGEAGLDAPVVSRRLTRGSVQASLPEVLGMSPDAMARLGAAQRVRLDLKPLMPLVSFVMLVVLDVGHTTSGSWLVACALFCGHGITLTWGCCHMKPEGMCVCVCKS